jgi:hypothetical protein
MGKKQIEGILIASKSIEIVEIPEIPAFNLKFFLRFKVKGGYF